jgi:uncharacterized membrane protein
MISTTVVVIVAVGIAIRLAYLAAGAAKVGFLPESWQRWIFGQGEEKKAS